MDELRIATVKGPLTLEGALKSESDVLPTLTALQDTVSFRRDQLEAHRPQIVVLISQHLNIPSTKFDLSPTSEWIYGSFNICLPIEIFDTHRLPRNALMRFAMPHAIGESHSSGAVNEKVRCEAATYVWLERECPRIPIPRLLGIGFPGSRSVEAASWPNWALWHIRYAWKWLQGRALPRLVAHDRTALHDLGYLLIEYVDSGTMLSSSWNQHRNDPQKRKNLYSSLANIMLDLSKVTLPRIGSWTMNNKGAIALENRPFHDLSAFWSRHNIPLNIPRDLTYSSTEMFVQDLLAYQDARMLHQPNSILDRDDGISQLAALVGLRAMLPGLFNKRLSCGRFIMNFTDLHQSNIFVDEDWNITRIIDLEFAYSCPIELIHVPFWLSGHGIDELEGQNLEVFKLLHDQFVDVVIDREKATQQNNEFSQHLRKEWESGRIWYSMALSSLNAFPALFAQHLRPRYFQKWQFESHAWPLAQLWIENVSSFLQAKVDGMQEYNMKVRQVFGEVAEAQNVTARAGEVAT